MPYKTFVKARDTSTPVSRSQAELERILRRYGASGFGVQQDYQAHTARVFFRVPDDVRADQPRAQIPVRLEVDIAAVARALGYETGSLHPTEHGWAQAERVAWRHLVLWVDAALSAAAAGLQKVSEAFLAQTLVKTQEGQVLRVIDEMNAHNWRAMLSPPAPTP